MATVNNNATQTQQTKPTQISLEGVAGSLASMDLNPDDSPTTPSDEENDTKPPRPLYIYTRKQILYLSKSPLVKPPDGMPPLKDWFGDWSEQISSKKESEASGNSTNARERRFRRDLDEGDAPARPTFRATLSQPSQMGNFRHQSLRTTERDRDVDRERQRDERDREGQERLRSLSDKYDRDRLALSSSALRNKERDVAPHLMSGSSSRLPQGQNGTTARRGEIREPGKKKPGETSDDWRRGPDSSRTSRDERPDTIRNKDRERPRSRVRDLSRSRREPSTTRNRDKEDKDRPRRGDDREESRRDRDDFSRRDRDDYTRRDWDERDRDDHRDRHDRDEEDSRRWRDDGKRDERQAARRERERGDRGWDRWEPSHDRDRPEDREARTKRPSARERRAGAAGDDAKDRDDRREKEPAWMETYVPPESGGGILGGRGNEGELDGIQAWKKGMKEREKKEKEKEGDGSMEPSPKIEAGSAIKLDSASSDAPLDEIQMFKLLMKEAANKDAPESATATTNAGTSGDRSPLPKQTPSAPSANFTPTNISSSTTPDSTKVSNALSPSATVPSDGARILSFLTQGPTDSASGQGPASATQSLSSQHTTDGLAPAVSRMFPTLPSSSSPGAQERSGEDAIPASASFNPPAGSRLLALGSRPPASSSNNLLYKSYNTNDPATALASSIQPGLHAPNSQKPNTMTPPVMTLNMLTQSPEGFSTYNIEHQPPFRIGSRPIPSERSPRSFSPMGHPSQHGYPGEMQEDHRFAQGIDTMRRQGQAGPASDRIGLGLGSEPTTPFVDFGGGPNIPSNGSSYDLTGNVLGGGAPAMKGSRFAKFFDNKNREVQGDSPMRKPQGQGGPMSTSPLPSFRQGMNGSPVNIADNRTMEDLFAMLQNSSQNHRASPQLQQHPRIPSGGAFGPSPIDLQALQHQQQLQQQQQQQLAQQNARLDTLYDNRLDDRNFVPDGLVPGLRPAPRPRSREPSGVLYNEHVDDSLQFAGQRIPQPQRNLEPILPGPMQSMYGQLGGIPRNGAVALQQGQFRGGPSAMASMNIHQGPSQRLPPGLANLGGRPPHDPSQYLTGPGNNVHVGLQSAPAQQSFNGFGGGNINFSGGTSARGPVPTLHHQTPLTLNQMGGLGPNPNNIDSRTANHLLAMNGPTLAGGPGNSIGGGLRGAGGPGFHQQPPQLQAQQMLRHQQPPQQQQPQHIPPHLLSAMVPPHLQQHQQQGVHVGNSQGTQDLMALLMGGQRE